jgi:hypothetical protein
VKVLRPIGPCRNVCEASVAEACSCATASCVADEEAGARHSQENIFERRWERRANVKLTGGGTAWMRACSAWESDVPLSYFETAAAAHLFEGAGAVAAADGGRRGAEEVRREGDSGRGESTGLLAVLAETVSSALNWKLVQFLNMMKLRGYNKICIFLFHKFVNLL